MSLYCSFAPGRPLHAAYHDHEYGFPLTDDARLFERLCLEIMQAGLSWGLILKRRDGIVRAFDHFAVAAVAAYDDSALARLTADTGSIRNRRKIAAIVENARRLEKLRQNGQTFAAWIAAHHPRQKDEWVALFRRTFAFMGVEIVGEFLMSIGCLPRAHAPDCPVYARIAALSPPWMEAERQGFVYRDLQPPLSGPD